MRLLYHAINGSGLGHLVRVSTVASAVRSLDPEVHQLVVTHSPNTEHLRAAGLPFIVLAEQDGTPPRPGPDQRIRTLPHSTSYGMLARVVDEYDPALVVFDTHFDAGLIKTLTAGGRRIALVLRRTRAGYVRRLLDRGLLAYFARIIVPHDRANIVIGDSQLDDALAAAEEVTDIRYVGPVVRVVDTPANVVRKRLELAPDARLAIVTCGSGGIQPQAERILRDGVEALLALGDRDLTVVAVGGPNARHPALPPGCRYVPSEPDLPAIYPQAEVVVAQASYNTVHEVLQAGARGVFVAMDRFNEDQAASLLPHVLEGDVRCVPFGTSRADLTEHVRSILAAPRPEPRIFAGRTRAAEALLDVLPGIARVAVGSPIASPRWQRTTSMARAAHLIEASGKPAALLLPWTLIARRDDGAASSEPIPWYSVAELLVDLFEGIDEELTRRALAVMEGLGANPRPYTVTLVLTDRRGGGQLLPLLTALVADPPTAIVVRVPASVLDQTEAARFEVLEVCRRRHPSVKVDITALDRPVLLVR